VLRLYNNIWRGLCLCDFSALMGDLKESLPVSAVAFDKGGKKNHGAYKVYIRLPTLWLLRFEEDGLSQPLYCPPQLVSPNRCRRGSAQR
jgi:hypothetical protein